MIVDYSTNAGPKHYYKLINAIKTYFNKEVVSMPVAYQLVPEHVYPSQLVQINDNTEVSESFSVASGNTRFLCVFASPKGHDNEVRTITTGLAGFMAEYGLGSFDLYGQPALNAYAAAASGQATLHCMRVMPADASYAATTLVVELTIDADAKTIKAKFSNKVAEAGTPLKDRAQLAEFVTVTGDEKKVFAMCYQGRGDCGNKFRYRLTSDGNSDKDNAYKNYNLGIYESSTGSDLTQVGTLFSGAFTEDAVANGVSIYLDGKISDPNTGSDVIDFVSFPETFKYIFEEYLKLNPDTALTAETFDPLLGIDKTTGKAIPGYTIDTETEGAVVVNTLFGLPLGGGSDGAFAANADPTTRKAAIDAAYTAAFSGTTDPFIKSKKRFPTDIILDAGYDVEIKKLIAQLALTRTDCVVGLDLGTKIVTKQSVLDQFEANLAAVLNNRVQFVDAYCGKVVDPYSKKLVTVTSTYFLASAYPAWFAAQGGKHVPMAGNTYGEITGYVSGSIFPVFDDDLDAELMDECATKHINIAKLSPDMSVVRMIQDTMQTKKTVMSDLNNVFVLNDIKRDAEDLCKMVEFKFNDGENIARFNTLLANITNKYAAAQVKSITAAFSANDWEIEHQCVHLNVAFATRDIMKHSLIEIDINRS